MVRKRGEEWEIGREDSAHEVIGFFDEATTPEGGGGGM